MTTPPDPTTHTRRASYGADDRDDPAVRSGLLAARFAIARPALRGLAYRMLGSMPDAEDAVQDAWLRLHRAAARTDAGDAPRAVENVEGWLTTVVARVCLDVLRTRARGARRDASLDVSPPAVEQLPASHDVADEAQVADAVGLALLVVLDRLSPAERVAFVLHDAFDLPFEAIAAVVGRTPAAARQLASRARRRVRGTPLREAARLRTGARDALDAPRDRRDLTLAQRQEQRAVVDAYLAASRAGDLGALLAVLDPDVVLRPDPADVARGVPAEVRGARAVAGRALAYAERAPFAAAALVDGAVGVVVAPRGRLVSALRLTVARGRVAAIDVVTDPARLARLDLAVPET